jgi:hypothetical protein
MNSEPYILNDLSDTDRKMLKSIRERRKRARDTETTSEFDNLFRATEPEVEIPEGQLDRSIIEKWQCPDLPAGMEIRHGNSRLMFQKFNGKEAKFWREYYHKI